MQLVDIVKGKSPIEMLYHWEKETPNSIYLRQPIDGTWYEYTWSQVADKVRRLTTALYNLGLERGDRIAILSKNCAEWLITDLALQLGGFVSVPLYFDQSEETFTYILEHSEARAIFVGKLDQPVWHRLRNSIPEGVIKIGFSYYGADGDCQREQDVDYLVPDLIAKAAPFEGSPVPADDDIWTIVYTSGTTGYPKGAVHCYRAPRHVAVRALSIFDLNPSDRALSFLPLAHVAERLLVANNSLYSGMQVSFSQSLKTFQHDLCSVQPTIFFSVPRLWKKFQSGILEKVPQKKLDRMLKIPLLRGMVAKKLRVALGLSQARIIVSGAAAISPSLLDWYAKLGIEIVEGYGMTENLAYGFIGRPGANKSGTVGQAMPDNGFKLSEEGEILFKSPTLMAGYYKDEEKSKEAMTDDGYYRTGDLGVLDGQGFLRISGRVKEIFKTEKGEYVAPAPIESKLAAYKGFEQICLGGVGLVQPVAVVTLTEQIRDQPRDVLEQEIRDFVRELNGNLLNHEKISGIVVANQDWSPDSGLVTPTLKIKRSRLEARYAPYMAQLAPPERVVVWEEG